MSYSQAVFAQGEFYHIFNRGVEQRLVFSDRRDYQRFLQTLDYYRFKNPPSRFSFKSRSIKKPHDPSLLVEIVAFCLMPNHFHLLLKQVEENGISIFLSKVSNSYTKYFNTKHKRVGPLLQGSFKAVRVESDEQLVHLSRYIHLNPLMGYLVKNLKEYQFSSYNQFLELSDGFCQPEYVLAQFSSPADYEQFVLDQVDYGRAIKNMERLLLEEGKRG